MTKALGKMLKIQPDEYKLFLWSAVLIFVIRASAVIFNNFAETAFLKRFGVEYLPMVYVANSIVTFLIMGALTGFLKKMPSAKVLGGMLIICGGSVALLRLVVIGDFAFIYPVLFLLKAQYEALLSLVFWNLANDLFNTRQSKRIFPLITAGGVLGGVLGSFGTPPMVKLININNLMLVYLGTTCLAALVVGRMSLAFPTLQLTERTVKKTSKRSSIVEEIKKVVPLLKESTLVKILVLITFLPNVLIPIMNYQFNFAIDEAFKTEGGMIAFFGYFRGFLNVISFVILMFVGKLYSKWGLPVALMFHPANYIVAFLAFLFRFDIYSAMYSRISTNVLRTTINNPARDILMGLFPAEYRPLLRPFLRGTVVRLGILLGSGFIILFEGWAHPKYLSIVGVVFGGAWVLSSVWLKKSYSSILLDLVSHNMVDLKSLEPSDLNHVFKDRGAQNRLVEACRSSDGQTCIWYAEMMTSQDVQGSDDFILDLLLEKNGPTVRGLLPLVSAQAGPKAIKVFSLLAEPQKPKMNQALAMAASRLPAELSHDFLEKLLQENEDLDVKSQAVIGLYQHDPQTYGAMISAWLNSDRRPEQRAGIRAAGGSQDQAFLDKLRELYEPAQDADLARMVLIARSSIGDPEMPGLVVELLEKDPSLLPLEVMEDFTPQDKRSTLALIRLLGNEDTQLREIAQKRLEKTPELDLGLVIESLAMPNRSIREGLLELMSALKISDLEVIGFAKSQMEDAYQNLAEAHALETLPESVERNLFRDHLHDMAAGRSEMVLRVLATQDESDRMRIVVRGIESTDSRLRSNAVEALETIAGHKLSDAMIPLLEDAPIDETLDIGRKQFKIKTDFGAAPELLEHLLSKQHWVSQFLALVLVVRTGDPGPHQETIGRLLESDNYFVKRLAGCLTSGGNCLTKKEEAVEMAEATSLSEKILYLRAMDIFDGLKVSELAAVAAVCTEEVFEPQAKIVTEGEEGETMYLVTKGEVSVYKCGEDGCDVYLADMGEGDYFGEMALFDDQTRSATVIAKEDTHCLVLHKREFSETVHEYPQVALQICKELSRRLRELHQKVKNLPE